MFTDCDVRDYTTHYKNIGIGELKMQYRVSTTTSTKNIRLITYIKADNIPDVINSIKAYNTKHPDWDMKLLQGVGYSDEQLMPIEYVNG